jgi:hypothetical protein
MYISETNCHTRIRLMSSERKTLQVFFYHSRLTRKRRHIFAILLGVTWTESWLGYELVEMNQSLGLLGRQI